MGFIRMVLGDVSCFDDGDVGLHVCTWCSDHDIYTYAVKKEDKEKKVYERVGPFLEPSSIL